MSENYYHSSKNFWSDEREERKKVDKGIDVLSEIDKKLQKAFEILETDEYGLMETSSYDGIEEEIENCRELNNKAWDYASMIHEVLDEKEEVFHKALSKALEEISLININDYEVENTLGIQEFYTAANTTGNYNYQGNNKNTVTTERLKEKITFSDIMAKTDTYHLKEQFQKYLTDEKKNMKMMSDVEIAKYKEDFYDMVFTTSFDHEVYSNLGGVSEFLDYIPVIGGIKSLGEAISGYTMSGEKLKTNERVTQGVLGTLSVVVDVFTLGAISVAAKGTKAIATGIGKFTASDIIAGYSTKYTSEAMSDLGASPELIMGTHILTGLAVGKYTNYKSEMNSIKRLAGLDNLEQVKDMMKYSNLSAKELENLLKKSSIESILGVDKMNLVNKLKEGASGADSIDDWAKHMSPEDAKRYELWNSLRENGLDQAKINDIILTNKGLRPNPNTYLSETYIKNHLKQFDGGVTKIMTQAPTGTAGPPGGTFVMPSSVADDLIVQAGGDVSKLEKLLSLEPGTLGSSPVRVDVKNPSNLRVPSGNELGANSQWLPGGNTGGGIPEATITSPKPGDYIVKPIK